MKKLAFYMSLIVTGLLMAACSKDDFKDWAAQKTYLPEDAITIPGYTASPASAAGIDLNAETGETVQLINLSGAALPEGYLLNGVRAYIIPADDETAEPVVLKAANAEGFFSVADLQEAVVKFYGPRPAARTFKAHVYADAIKDGQSALIDAGETNIILTPIAPFIDNGYYLTGDFAGWNKEGALAFTHIGSADVYENPEFQILFTTTADNQYWKIISKTNYDNDFWAEGTTGVVGTKVDGDTSAEGQLTTEHPQAGKIEKAGIYMLTINMMEYSYTIKPVAPQFYMVGALPGWNAEGAAKALLYPQSNTTMQYTSKFTGAWDLKLWNKNDLGNWDACYGCTVDGDNSASGALINSNAQAISSPTAEFYTFKVDLASMTYSWTKLENQTPTEYSKMGIIGEFNGWSTDVEMTQVTPHNWYVVATVTDGGLKFRANADWGINWGAQLTISDSDFYGKGVQGGNDITVTAGTYAFYINDITGDFAIVKQ